jgi:hypothetical protein
MMGWMASVIFLAGVKMFSLLYSIQYLDWLWGPPSLLLKGSQGFFLGGKVARE